MPKEYDYIHCGNCGSIMRDWSKSSEVKGDYTPNDAREIDKSVDIMHEDMILLAHIVESLKRDALPWVLDVLSDAGRTLIRLEEELASFAQYGGTFDEDQEKVVAESEIPKVLSAEWSEAEDDEDPAIILDPRHAAIAYDYLSDHLRILLTGESYQVRGFRTAEENAMRTILKALNPSRLAFDTQNRLAHPPSLPLMYGSNKAIIPLRDTLHCVYSFDESDVAPHKILKQGAKLLKTIAKLSSQGKKVFVYVTTQNNEVSQQQ